MEKKKIGTKLAIVVGVSVIIVAAAAVTVSAYAGRYFAKGTTINGIDVSGMTIENLKSKIDDYNISIIERFSENEYGNCESFTENIAGSEIYLRVGSDEKLEEILDEQSLWNVFFGSEQNYDMADALSYDENKLAERIYALTCMQDDKVIAPTDARLAGYSSEAGQFVIQPETLGNQLDKEKTIKKINEAVRNLKKSINLEEEDCYVKANVLSSDENLIKQNNALNTYASAKITYNFGKNKEVVDGSLIQQWIKIKKDFTVKIKRQKINDYIDKLAKKYDTLGSERKFTTATGKVVKIKGGDYGWKINAEKEKEKLYEYVREGKKIEKKPEYLAKANSHGEQDMGTTYVEVDLTNQHVYVIKKNKAVFDCSCVTGCVAKGHGTPEGVYDITYKQLHAVLRGPGYASPVTYWMPFNGGIGLHDATWRSSFGGNIYMYSGSHGCVNLPYSAAGKIFELVDQGTPVVCYYVNSSTLVSEDKESKVAEEPKETKKPKVTEKPGETKKPKVTEKPRETKKPKVTEKPKTTKKPKITKKPKTTKKTKTTKEPDETEKPDDTENADDID